MMRGVFIRVGVPEWPTMRPKEALINSLGSRELSGRSR